MRCIAFFFLILTALSAAYAAPPPVQTVHEVDLKRYAGKWYEIASVPMVFQRDCVGDTTAEYTLNADGTISVNSRCRARNGSISAASGTATVMPGSGNAKLEVSYPQIVKGHYWIIGLDQEYRWAVIGEPQRKYLRILSRTAQLPEEELARALDAARAQGYTLEELRYTQQSP